MEELVEESLVYLADRIMDLCNSKCDVTGLPNPLFSQFSKDVSGLLKMCSGDRPFYLSS
eukprot:gene14279-20253_t